MKVILILIYNFLIFSNSNDFEKGELLYKQNKFQEAFAKLDTLVQKFPKHSLQDDVLWLEAQIHIKKRDYSLILLIDSMIC